MLRNTIGKTAFFFLFLMVLKGVSVVETDEVKSVSVTEGDSVTLNTDIKVQKDDLILWNFGLREARIAEIYKQTTDIQNSYETFGDRLQMDSQTGSLTIRNIRTDHSGLYKLQIGRSKETSYKRFNVTVYAHLPVLNITSNSSNCSSSSRSSESNCSLLCSAVNVSHVTLSWFKGNSLLSSISVSDLSIRLSLPLEVEYQDKNTYSCVINNPISNQTQHLNVTQLCHTCADLTALTIFLAAFIPTVLLVILVGVMYFLNRKRKRIDEKGNSLGFEPCAHTVEPVQTEEEEVQYAETGFCRKNDQKKKAKEIPETIYSSVVT
ncbi:CD48 antigen-like isoform X2 [Ctenopharyngodon idella]|uniref:CD48 antigen-like isoform X2 n=1 Tax=Ctenopharyngodon idella TaxID=7959 RepID=UPI00222EFF2A|nr:CD48 antigen-like isoform X2 [Ctenopharyngodon idella]